MNLLVAGILLLSDSPVYMIPNCRAIREILVMLLTLEVPGRNPGNDLLLVHLRHHAGSNLVRGCDLPPK